MIGLNAAPSSRSDNWAAPNFGRKKCRRLLRESHFSSDDTAALADDDDDEANISVSLKKLGVLRCLASLLDPLRGDVSVFPGDELVRFIYVAVALGYQL